MSKSKELKDKIINQTYTGTLYPDFEEVLEMIDTLEELERSIKLGLSDLEHELIDKEAVEIQDTLTNINTTINKLADSLFVEDEKNDSKS